MSEKEMEVSERRGFFFTLAAAGVGLLGTAAAAMAGGFLYPIERKKPSPLFICLESEVPDDHPLELADLEGRKVLLMHHPGGGLLAVSTVCSHLGCSVFYRPERGEFDCPCHNGRFDREGNPLSGPPQSPLARYPVEVRGGKVFIQFS